jgi:hypothetical protein
MLSKVGFASVGLLIVVGSGCRNRAAECPNAAGDAKHGAKTAGTAVVTSGETALSGIETLGKTIGGYVEGGKAEAKKNWNDGKKKTSTAAKSGASDTKSEAKSADCE